MLPLLGFGEEQLQLATQGGVIMWCRALACSGRPFSGLSKVTSRNALGRYTCAASQFLDNTGTVHAAR